MTFAQAALLPIAAILFAANASASPNTPRAQAHALALEASVHVEALRSLTDQVEDEAVRQAMSRQLTQLDGTVQALDRLLVVQQIAIPTPAPPVAFSPPMVQAQVQLAGPATHVQVEIQTSPTAVETVATEPMDETGLTRLLSSLEQEPFSDARLGILRSAIQAPSGFSMDQAIRVLEVFDFGSDKVEAAAMLYPQIIDRERWYVVYGSFDFDTDKDALRARVGE